MSYSVLLDKIKRISEENRVYIEDIKLSENTSLFLLKNNYPYLPPQISTHSAVALPDDKMSKIISLMKSNKDIKNFLSVDIQYFVNLLIKSPELFISKFKREFEGIKIQQTRDKRKFLDKIKNICLDDYSEDRNIGLQIFKFIGFATPFYDSLDSELEEPKSFLAKCLQRYYFESIWKFNNERPNFEKQIVRPFKDIIEILGDIDSIQTNGRSIVYLELPNIMKKEIQDFLCCLQYHIFFEEYVNSIVDNEKGKIIKNPLIIFNPSEENDGHGKRILEGYFELDGSLFIGEKETLYLIECKNGYNIKPDHITHFLGKVYIIEEIYGIKIKKMLFSTGERFPLWKDVEVFPKFCNICIFDKKSFMNGFSDLSI